MKNKAFAFILLAIAGLLPIMIMASCGKEEVEEVKIPNNLADQSTEQPKNTDTYYVKYEVQNGNIINTSIRYNERNITYKDINNLYTITTRDEWEGTYGPFKKGDKVNLRVITSMYRNYTNARISVSKNKEAFAIKAEKRESNKIDLEYTIDF